MEWIDFKIKAPDHLRQCVFKLNNGNYCLGKVRYFEYGDSEMIEVYGKCLNMYKQTYRNCELHDFNRNKYSITHYAYLD